MSDRGYDRGHGRERSNHSHGAQSHSSQYQSFGRDHSQSRDDHRDRNRSGRDNSNNYHSNIRSDNYGAMTAYGVFRDHERPDESAGNSSTDHESEDPFAKWSKQARTNGGRKKKKQDVDNLGQKIGQNCMSHT